MNFYTIWTHSIELLKLMIQNLFSSISAKWYELVLSTIIFKIQIFPT